MSVIQVVLGRLRTADIRRSADIKRPKAGRLRRGAVVLGVVGLAAGAAVASAGSALAANGSQPGNLTLSPASGAATLTPTWSTSTACPSGFQGSAVVEEFNTDSSTATRISLVINSPTADDHLHRIPAQGDGRVRAGRSDLLTPGMREDASGC